MSKLEKYWSNWSDLPCDILECLIGRLPWPDRTRIRAVCKAWSVPMDKLPLAFKYFIWNPIENDRRKGECRVLDPLSREYIVEISLRGRYECFVAKFRDSACGWVLFEKLLRVKFAKDMPLFLYSPFTNEVIMLPYLGDPKSMYRVSAFSLNATSPKCYIFKLGIERDYHNVNVMLFCVGDRSSKTFKFDSGVQPDKVNFPISAVYGNGVFYCLFAQGELGVFDVELEEWRMLTNYRPPNFFSTVAKLIVFGANLWLWNHDRNELFKFDFSEMCWVYETDLNDHVLFVGRGASFAVPAVEEISPLANTIVSCLDGDRDVICYGSTSRSRSRLRKSLLYRNCIEAAKNAMGWIEPPSGRIWRANDLTNAV